MTQLEMTEQKVAAVDIVAALQPVRVKWLDGLRGIGAVQVCLLHLSEKFVITTPRSPLCVFYDGALAVFLFFCISGFVISKWSAAFDRSAVLLVLSRAARLFIPSVAACLFAAIVWEIFRGPYPEYYRLLGLPISLVPYLHNLLLDIFVYVPFLGHPSASFFASYLGSWNQHSFTIGPLWTINVEFIGSILVIALELCHRRYPTATRNYVVPIIFFLSIKSLLLPFVFGHILSHWSGYKTLQGKTWISVILLIAACFLTVDATNGIYYGLFDYIARLNYLIPTQSAYSVQKAAAAIMIFFGVFIAIDWQRLLASKTCKFLGQISFPLYLVHYPLLIVFVFTRASMEKSGGSVFTSTAIALIAFVVPLAGAVTAFLYVDKFSIEINRLILAVDIRSLIAKQENIKVKHP